MEMKFIDIFFKKFIPSRSIIGKICCIFAFASGLAFGGSARAQSSKFYLPLPTRGIFLQNLPYGNNQAEILDVCRPATAVKPHPGLIMIHGGEWIHGDKTGLMDTWCQNFAKLGYVAVNINYRLDNPARAKPDWPAFQIGDVQLAIRWMRYHAQELGLDPTRVCAYGTSAGGYLTVFAGTQHDIYPSDVDWIAPRVAVGLSCLIDGFGPVDLTAATYQTKNVTALLGVTYSQNPGLYRLDSPLFHVNARTPPALVIHGTADTTVPIAQSRELVAALQRDGVPVRLFTYNGGHAYHGLSAAGLNQVFQQIAGSLKFRIGT